MKKIKFIAMVLFWGAFIAPVNASLYNAELLTPGGLGSSSIRVNGSFGDQYLSREVALVVRTGDGNL